MLTVSGLPAHTQLALEFDLYLFNSWDGNVVGSDGTFGPDFFSLSNDITFSETFTNHQVSSGLPDQTYPGAPDLCFGNCGVGFFGAGDTHVYRGLDPTGFGSEFLISHNLSTFSVTFGGPTDQADEQWSIDNVVVTIDGNNVVSVPEPTTLSMLGAGLLGLGAIAWRRRRAARGRA